MKEKRISFGEYEARNIYEWWLALVQGVGKTNAVVAACDSCITTKKRLEKFIGKSAVVGLKRLVKKNPYYPRKK